MASMIVVYLSDQKPYKEFRFYRRESSSKSFEASALAKAAAEKLHGPIAWEKDLGKIKNTDSRAIEVGYLSESPK